MKRKLIMIFTVLAILCSMPSISEASRAITFVNKTSHDIYVAVRFKHKSNGWMTEGWWYVKAKSSAGVNLDSNNNVIYILGQNVGAGEYWRGDTNDKQDRSFTVVNEPFKVIGDNSPRGSGRKKERFNRASFKNNRLVYTFTQN